MEVFDEDADEFPTAEEEAESVGLEERARWDSRRAALLRAWACIAAEEARLQVLWDAEKAQEDALERRRFDANAAVWTAAEPSEAQRECAAMARAAVAQRAIWRSFATSVFEAVEAAIMTETL